MQSWQEMAEGKKQVNVALCGFGRAGRIHFNGVRQNHRITLKYIVDKLDNKAAGADSQLDVSVGDFIHSQLAEFNLESVQVVDCSKYDTVLQDSSIDAVVIATPTYTHEECVTKALQAKKAVFCEKPVAPSLESTARCYDMAAKEGVPLYCAFQRRFDPGFSRIYRQVKEGTIGKVYQIKTTSRDSPRPSIEYLKTSNRMYHDCAVHDIDMACWIVGEEPEGVFAQGTTRDPEIISAIDDVDTAAIILKFPSGVLAIIDLSRHSKYGYDQRLEVFGEKGMLLCENPPKDSVLTFNSEGTTGANTFYSFPQRYELAYRYEMDHFACVLLDPSKELLVKRADTLLSSRVADACERSQKEGKMVTLAPSP